MITRTPLTTELEDRASRLWFVFTGNGLTMRGAFRDINEALIFVHNGIAQNLRFEADLKCEGCDDHSDLPLGALTGLSWNCPSRKMTRDEVLARKSQFEKQWLKSPPMKPDFERAESQNIKFIGEQVNAIAIRLGSRYIGYIHRSGRLNDKTRDIDDMITAINDLDARVG